MNAVKDGLLNTGIISGGLMAFIPVGIFDHKLHPGIDLLRFGDDLLGKSLHLGLPEVLPALFSLGLDAHFAPAGSEEEVVQNDLVKSFRRVPDHLKILLPVLRIRIAEGIEIRRLLNPVHQRGGGNASGRLQAVGFQDLPDPAQALHGNIRGGPVVFHVDLLQRNGPQIGFNPLPQLLVRFVRYVIRVHVRGQ